MTTQRINTLLVAVAVVLGCEFASGPLTAIAAPQIGAGCARRHCNSGGQCNGCMSCPECGGQGCAVPEEYCELEISEGKESKTCFEIDFKTICIPKVVPPWRQCCDPVCAEARSVKILKTKKYECPVCKYKWTVKQCELPQMAPSGPAAAVQNRFPMNTQSPAQTPMPAFGDVLRGNVPIIPAGNSKPAPSFIVPGTPNIPPAPPVSGSIGDYFGGR